MGFPGTPRLIAKAPVRWGVEDSECAFFTQKYGVVDGLRGARGVDGGSQGVQRRSWPEMGEKRAVCVRVAEGRGSLEPNNK